MDTSALVKSLVRTTPALHQHAWEPGSPQHSVLRMCSLQLVVTTELEALGDCQRQLLLQLAGVAHE